MSSGVVTPAVPPSTVPLSSQLETSSAGSRPSDSTHMEVIVALLRRLEAKFDTKGEQGQSSYTVPRPEPDPPYGMPPGWQSPAWFPGVSSVPPSQPIITYAPSRPTAVSGAASWGNDQQRLGFSQTLSLQQPAGGYASSPWEPTVSHPPFSAHSGNLPHSRFPPEHTAPRFQQQPSATEPARLMKMDPPVFDGTNAHSWVTRIQYYFDLIRLPEEHRLQYVMMLFAPPTTDWIFAYRANNPLASWPQFLDDVRRRFDPNYFVNYVELIAKLTQTGSVADYNKEFDRMLNHIQGVAESTLMSMYLGGLKPSIKSQVRFQHPTSVAAAMAIAMELDTAGDRSVAASRRPWQGRDFRQPPLSSPSSGSTDQPSNPPTGKSRDYSKLPVVRLTAAEKAEKSRLGLCWYCSDKWATGHVCKERFLTYHGSDDEDDEPLQNAPPVGEEVITADLSHLYSMDGKPRTTALEFQGFLGKAEVFILVDTGCTHNFLHPKIAEKIQLPLKAIRPFRVYVGNGQSMVCSNLASKVELRIQGHAMTLDLHILPIHGPDIILGLAWLGSLRRVTSDYDAGTLEFQSRGRPVCLKVSPRSPRQVSARTLASIMLHQDSADCFEIVPFEESETATVEPLELPSNLPTAVRETLQQHAAVFSIPTGLPPTRAFDHRIHLLPQTKPVNVRPYRYPYFQKHEIERQVKEMLDSGIIRRSSSAFSSPVLLIRKKDGSFRFVLIIEPSTR